MGIFKQTPKESQKLSQLIDKICKEFGIDKVVALHFINNDLERLYSLKDQIDILKLNELENQIHKHIKSESQLQEELRQKSSSLNDLQIKLDELKKTIVAKNELLSNLQNDVDEKKTKLRDLNNGVRKLEQEKKEVDYDLMMKKHSEKEKDDKYYRYFKLFLVFITIAAIIIVTLLIYKK